MSRTRGERIIIYYDLIAAVVAGRQCVIGTPPETSDHYNIGNILHTRRLHTHTHTHTHTPLIHIETHISSRTKRRKPTLTHTHTHNNSTAARRRENALHYFADARRPSNPPPPPPQLSPPRTRALRIGRIIVAVLLLDEMNCTS